jgi:8-oxo-dGTP pyrophosphatase MutT (NUDIX family)
MSQKYEVFIHDCQVLFLPELSSGQLDRMNCLSIHADITQDFDLIRDIIEENPNLESICLFSESIDELWRTFKSEHKIVEAAGGLVTNSEGHILCIFRRGKWDLPKGKLESGETIEVAAIREVEEECGITGPIISSQLETTWHTYEEKGKRILKPTYWFAMNYTGLDKLVPQEKEKITEVRWVSKNELPGIRSQSFKSLSPIFDHAINHPTL